MAETQARAVARTENRRAIDHLLVADRSPFAPARRRAVMAFCEDHDGRPIDATWQDAAALLVVLDAYEEARGGAKVPSPEAYNAAGRAMPDGMRPCIGAITAYERARAGAAIGERRHAHRSNGTTCIAFRASAAPPAGIERFFKRVEPPSSSPSLGLVEVQRHSLLDAPLPTVTGADPPAANQPHTNDLQGAMAQAWTVLAKKYPIANALIVLEQKLWPVTFGDLNDDKRAEMVRLLLRLAGDYYRGIYKDRIVELANRIRYDVVQSNPRCEPSLRQRLLPAPSSA